MNKALLMVIPLTLGLLSCANSNTSSNKASSSSGGGSSLGVPKTRDELITTIASSDSSHTDVKNELVTKVTTKSGANMQSNSEVTFYKGGMTNELKSMVILGQTYTMDETDYQRDSYMIKDDYLYHYGDYSSASHCYGYRLAIRDDKTELKDTDTEIHASSVDGTLDSFSYSPASLATTLSDYDTFKEGSFIPVSSVNGNGSFSVTAEAVETSDTSYHYVLSNAYGFSSDGTLARASLVTKTYDNLATTWDTSTNSPKDGAVPLETTDISVTYHYGSKLEAQPVDPATLYMTELGTVSFDDGPNGESIGVGEYIHVRCSGYAPTNALDFNNVRITSSDATIVGAYSVNSKGYRALKAGTCEVTVTSQMGLTKTVSLTVTE